MITVHLPEMSRGSFGFAIHHSTRFADARYERLGNSRLRVVGGLFYAENFVLECPQGARSIWYRGSESLIHWPTGEGMTIKGEDTGDTLVSLSAAQIPEYTHTGYCHVFLYKNNYESTIYGRVAELNPLGDSPSTHAIAMVNFYGASLKFYVYDGTDYIFTTTISDGEVYWWDAASSGVNGFHLKKLDDTMLSSQVTGGVDYLRAITIYPHEYEDSETPRLYAHFTPWNQAVQ